MVLSRSVKKRGDADGAGARARGSFEAKGGRGVGRAARRRGGAARRGDERRLVEVVGADAEVAAVELRALEGLDRGRGALLVGVGEDGRARGAVVLAAREELDVDDLADAAAVRLEARGDRCSFDDIVAEVFALS